MTFWIIYKSTSNYPSPRASHRKTPLLNKPPYVRLMLSENWGTASNLYVRALVRTFLNFFLSLFLKSNLRLCIAHSARTWHFLGIFVSSTEHPFKPWSIAPYRHTQTTLDYPSRSGPYKFRWTIEQAVYREILNYGNRFRWF